MQELHSIRPLEKVEDLLPSGYYDIQTWNALQKCWLDTLLPKIKANRTIYVHYASLIQKLEKELGIAVLSFEYLD